MTKTLNSLFLTLAILFLCSSHILADVQQDDRIVGGVAGSIKNTRYIVYLRDQGYFICGGSLITSQHVLTAAHCVYGGKVKDYVVVGGVSRLSAQGVRRTVSKIILPKNYNSNTLNKDMAVLKLSSPMTGKNIRTIKLCNTPLKVGDKLKISGWGVRSENAISVPNQLQTVKIPIIARKKCVSRYKGAASLTNSMFCATTSKKDSCSGDSGGPAVRGGRLCGIVSWGIGCARSKYPGVYTSVRRARSFINKAISL